MKRLRVITLLIISFALVSIGHAQLLKIVHFNVGQGTSTLIQSPSGKTMLVDAGGSICPNTADTIRAYFLSQGITNAVYNAGNHYFLATHYHADHIEGYIDLIIDYGYYPDIAYDRGSPGYGTLTYTNYVNAVGALRQSVTQGQIIDLGGGVTVQVVCVCGRLMNGQTVNIPSGDGYENERSICLLLTYRNFRYVVSGDLVGSGAYDLETLCAPLIGNINAMEINHHGSTYSTNNTWLNTLQAEATVVSVGDNNPYDYVNTATLSRIQNCSYTQHLYHTEQGWHTTGKSVVVNGKVFLETDGLTSYTVDGDLYDLGPDLFVSVWVDSVQTTLPIPAGGGRLYWSFNIQNHESYSINTHIHFWLQLPDASTQDLINIPSYPLYSGINATRTRQYNIYGSYPAGMYQLIAELRLASNQQLCATARDTFYKAGADVSGSGDVWLVEPSDVNQLDLYDPTTSSSQPTPVVQINGHPNPFNPTTTISYQLSAFDRVSLKIYDTAGRLVATLVDGWKDAGQHEVIFDGSNLPSGVYVYRLEAKPSLSGQTGELNASGKMLLLK